MLIRISVSMNGNNNNNNNNNNNDCLRRLVNFSLKKYVLLSDVLIHVFSLSVDSYWVSGSLRYILLL